MLTTSVERLEGNNIKLTVTVPAEEVDAAVKQAYEALGKKTRIPGFRKGHAPRAVVDNYMGKDHVLSEATEGLVDSTYPIAIDAENLRPIDSPDIEEVAVVVPGEDYTYVAAVEIRPELTLSRTDGLSAAVPPKNVTDAQIDEQIEMARERFASLEPVEDRALEADDFALISFVGYIDGEPYDGGEVDKYLYELGKGQMPANFDAGLLGMNAGDQKRIEFTIPATSSNEEYVGKTAGFDVTVHEIKAKVLPEVDDEFAVTVGGFDSVEAMREDLRVRLSGPQALQHERAKEAALKAQLAERLEGDVPESMVRTKTNQLMRDFRNMLEQQGMTIESYLSSTGVTIERVEADINEQGAQSVKEELALEALFRSEGMEVTDDEVREEIAAMVSDDENVDSMVKQWTDSGLLPVIREELVHRRAVGWLMDNSTITETDGTEAANAKAAAAAAGVAATADEAAAADVDTDVDDDAATETTEE